MSDKRYVLHRPAAAAAPPAWEADLDDEQRAVVLAPPGTLLVVAGAGSGKTRALTYRVAHLLHQGVLPERILLCTFTQRAAREMTRRVEALGGGDARRIWAGTFHHVGNLVLRQYADRMGRPADFAILDHTDAVDLLGRVVAERPRAATSRRFPQAGVLAAILSRAVNACRSIPAVVASDFDRFETEVDDLEAVAAAYAERKRRLNLADFDDLLLGWHAALLEHPAVSAELGERFAHVLVDEYQDVSRLQAEITDALASSSTSLMAVGDDDQSIYGFRGADADAMLRFPERHPGCRIFRLQTNYRSTPEVVALANRSIAVNRRRHDKTLRAARGAGGLPVAASVDDAHQQAAFVAQRVLELHEEEAIPFGDMAVLFRAHAHSLELELELTARQIPFAVRAGTRFLEQAHIKDVIAHLRLAVHPADELAALRVLRLQPGIGAATAARLVAAAVDHPVASIAEGLAGLAATAGVGPKVRAALAELGGRLGRIDPAGPAAPAIRTVVEGPYREHVLREYANADARLEDLAQLAGVAERYDALPAFLDEVAFMAGLAAESVRPGAPPDDLLTLSTVHQAKGLEWRVVFVISLCEGQFPSAPALAAPWGEEEERRLFHVAVTRARDQLVLTHPLMAEDRAHRRVMARPSRFLLEVDDPALLERWRVELE